MANRIIGVILLFSFGRVLAQYETIYVGPNPHQPIYDKTRQEIISNYLNNKPLLNYVPVYNTDYGEWESAGQKTPELAAKNPYPDVDFQRLGEVITRLKSDMQTLSHKTKHVYEDKLKELNEVKKLNENIKVALQNTDLLKNSFHQNEKQLMELWKTPQNGRMNPEGVDRFLKMVEGLESMVQNINYKEAGK